MPESRWPALIAAIGLGIAAAIATFPVHFVVPIAGLDWAPQGDAAQHAIAQRYFIADAWRWPILVVPALGHPTGTHIAFADGIPLLAVLLRTVAGWLPQGFHGIGLWYGIATILQSTAATWALQGTGERRLVPGIGIALAALAMPAWLARYGHAALTGHFLILAAWGCYLRLARAGTRWPWGFAVALCVAALLVHPYLASMVIAVVAAVPITLMARGRAVTHAATGLAGCVAATALAMAVLGYFGASGDGGYGQFAMNLLSPIWPHRSGLLGGLATTAIDATGKGGWEGYNWLGAGLLGGIGLVALSRPGAVWLAAQRHLGVVAVSAGLTALAISHRVGLGTSILMHVPVPTGALEQFRASGRFFWPVAYALLLGGMTLATRLGSSGPWLALAIGAVQTVDALPIRQDLRMWANAQPPWAIDAGALRHATAGANLVTIFPSWHCIARDDQQSFELVQQVLLVASERAVPVNTMHVARWTEPPVCDDAQQASAPFRSGEVRVLLPAAQAMLLPLVPGGDTLCRSAGNLSLCSAAELRPPRGGQAGGRRSTSDGR
jgi:hypothetical protein